MASVRSNGLRVCILNFILGIAESNQICLELFVQYDGLGVLFNWLAGVKPKKRSSQALRLRIVELLERLPILWHSESETSKIIAMLIKDYFGPGYNQVCSADDFPLGTSSDDTVVAEAVRHLVDEVEKVTDNECLSLIERITALKAKWATLPVYSNNYKNHQDDEKNSELNVDVNTQCVKRKANNMLSNDERLSGDQGFLISSMPQYMVDQFEQTIPRTLSNGACLILPGWNDRANTDLEHMMPYESFPIEGAESFDFDDSQSSNDAMSEDSDNDSDDYSQISTDYERKSSLSSSESSTSTNAYMMEATIPKSPLEILEPKDPLKIKEFSNTYKKDDTNCMIVSTDFAIASGNATGPPIDCPVFSSSSSASMISKQQLPEHPKSELASTNFVFPSSTMIPPQFLPPPYMPCGTYQPNIVSDPQSLAFSTFPPPFTMPNIMPPHIPSGLPITGSYPTLRYHNPLPNPVMPSQAFCYSPSIASTNLVRQNMMCLNRLPVYPNMDNFVRNPMFDPYQFNRPVSIPNSAFDHVRRSFIPRVPQMASTYYPSQPTSNFMVSPSFRDASGYFPYAMPQSEHQFIPPTFQPVPIRQFVTPSLPPMFTYPPSQERLQVPIRSEVPPVDGQIGELINNGLFQSEQINCMNVTNKSPSPKRVRVDSTSSVPHTTHNSETLPSEVGPYGWNMGNARRQVGKDTISTASCEELGFPIATADAVHAESIISSESLFLDKRMPLDERIQLHLEKECSDAVEKKQTEVVKIKCSKYSRMARLKKLRMRAMNTRFRQQGSSTVARETDTSLNGESREAEPRRICNTPTTQANGLSVLAKSADSGREDSAHSRIVKQFKTNLSQFVMALLSQYRQKSCTKGRISNHEDFKYLARKFTHAILEKEIERFNTTPGSKLEICKRVKVKTRVYIEKYMSKCPREYSRRNDSRECM